MQSQYIYQNQTQKYVNERPFGHKGWSEVRALLRANGSSPSFREFQISGTQHLNS